MIESLWVPSGLIPALGFGPPTLGPQLPRNRKGLTKRSFLHLGSRRSGHESAGTGSEGHAHEVIHQQGLGDTRPIAGLVQGSAGALEGEARPRPSL